jgi:hypothetical protein
MYFIIKTGYGENDFIRVDNLPDVEKAQYAFLTEAKVMFSSGQVCRGKDILTIKEDWHKEMGWNPTHEMTDDDWNELKQKGIENKYLGQLALAKDNVHTLLEAKRTDLIGKPGKIEERLKMLTSS